jgi:hypothetical protein
MWPFRKIACGVCGERFSKDQVKLSLRDRSIAVCRHCFEGWRMRGRKCGRCGEQVAGPQAVAVFPERQGLGHFDCGGIPLSA